jgi:hypothetical protein
MRSQSTVIAILPALLLLTACTAAQLTPTDAVPPCRQDCAVSIGLSTQINQRPVVPERYRVVSEQEVDFNVREARGQDARTILSFEEAAFVNERGNPVYTLELKPGSNRFRVRPYRDGVCRPPQGCRYVVINVGTPQRPGVINSPRIIIEPL